MRLVQSHGACHHTVPVQDGTVGYLDFGIVGRVSPVTWKAVEALLGAVATNDYRTMAQALATMKATGEEVCSLLFTVLL